MTDPEGPFVLRPIGWVESTLTDRRLAPRQGDEGAPEACLVFGQEVSEGVNSGSPAAARRRTVSPARTAPPA